MYSLKSEIKEKGKPIAIGDPIAAGSLNTF